MTVEQILRIDRLVAEHIFGRKIESGPSLNSFEMSVPSTPRYSVDIAQRMAKVQEGKVGGTTLVHKRVLSARARLGVLLGFVAG